MKKGNDIADHPEEFVSAPEAARMLGISQTTGWLWCKSGKLAAKFVAGRYLVKRDDVLKLRHSREIEALGRELDEITGKAADPLDLMKAAHEKPEIVKLR